MCSAYNEPTEEAVSSELEAVASARRKREVVGATEVLASDLGRGGQKRSVTEKRRKNVP